MIEWPSEQFPLSRTVSQSWKTPEPNVTNLGRKPQGQAVTNDENMQGYAKCLSYAIHT